MNKNHTVLKKVPNGLLEKRRSQFNTELSTKFFSYRGQEESRRPPKWVCEGTCDLLLTERHRGDPRRLFGPSVDRVLFYGTEVTSTY